MKSLVEGAAEWGNATEAAGRAPAAASWVKLRTAPARAPGPTYFR